MIFSVDGLDHFESDFELAQYMQTIVIGHATSENADNVHYQEIRGYFLDNPSTKELVPYWIRTSRDLSQFWGFIQPKFRTYAERRQFIWTEFVPLLDFLETLQRLPAEKSITHRLKQFDADGVHFAWQKALERISTDPEGAITLSRTILESVCKHILDDLGIEYDSNKIELHALYKMTAEELNLSPENHSEKIFKQILGGCSAVVNGLGSLRNKLGDAHGKGKLPVKPLPRHASLAVNLAGSMSLFLVETSHAQGK